VKARVGIGTIFLALGIFVGHQAIQLSLGRPSRPGPGFVAFGLGLILTLLSSLYLMQVSRRKSEDQPRPSRGGRSRTLLAVGLLCLYAAVLNSLGYLISTFLLFGIWLGFIEQKKWYLTLPIAFLALVAVYFFNYLFSVQLPKGSLKVF
jgi:putative tricarboxylic transport membrane protein